MWLGDLLPSWLPSVGLNTTRTDGFALETPLSLGPYVPARPSSIAVVTPLPGPGLSLDDAFDQPGFQLYVRGGQSDYQGLDAGRRAAEFDRNILFGDSLNRRVYTDAGESIGYLSSVQRAGGAPAPLGPPDNANRVEYTASYILLLHLD